MLMPRHASHFLGLFKKCCSFELLFILIKKYFVSYNMNGFTVMLGFFIIQKQSIDPKPFNGSEYEDNTSTSKQAQH